MRPQHDLGEAAAAVGVLGHGADRVVGVAGDHDPGGRAQVQVPQHVALREGRGQQLLRIPALWISPERRFRASRDRRGNAISAGLLPFVSLASGHHMVTVI